MGTKFSIPARGVMKPRQSPAEAEVYAQIGHRIFVFQGNLNFNKTFICKFIRRIDFHSCSLPVSCVVCTVNSCCLG